MSNTTARMGRVTLGEGMPKVCIPVMGRDERAIYANAGSAALSGADVIELRIDSLAPMPTLGASLAAIDAVKSAAGEIPVLFTLRTSRDGGPGSDDAAAYERLLCAVAASGKADGIDCELSVGEAAFARIARAAHDAGVTLVGSSHEFAVMDDFEITGAWLKRQAALGADVVKAAVMVKDHVQALEAALCMARAQAEIGKPMIAVAMGPAGVLTRAACACVGSCLTFGTAGQASAPGQMDAKALRGVLCAIDDALRGR